MSGAILVMSIAAGCASAGPAGSWGAGASPALTGTRGAAASNAPGASDVLAAALGPLRAASRYETTVEVGGTAVVEATGRSVAGANHVTVTTTGQTVEYVEVPPKAWARQGTGTWVLVAADQAPVAPLDVLAQPLTLTAAEGGSSLTATYPAAALGLEGDPLTVTIEIDGDAVTFRYVAPSGGPATTSTTTVRPGTTDPIAAPGD